MRRFTRWRVAASDIPMRLGELGVRHAPIDLELADDGLVGVVQTVAAHDHRPLPEAHLGHGLGEGLAKDAVDLLELLRPGDERR